MAALAKDSQQLSLKELTVLECWNMIVWQFWLYFKHSIFSNLVAEHKQHVFTEVQL